MHLLGRWFANILTVLIIVASSPLWIPAAMIVWIGHGMGLGSFAAGFNAAWSEFWKDAR